jgi:aspartyl-tRNA(Asn)/glutamyl-tRNA(Gln) amidotransferase subunit C
MKITEEEVIHVANLARLEIDDTALKKFSGQIREVLDYIDTLNQVDTTGVPPTSHAISQVNAFREDRVQGQLDREDALSNAPETEDGTFVVPKVVG